MPTLPVAAVVVLPTLVIVFSPQGSTMTSSDSDPPGVSGLPECSCSWNDQRMPECQDDNILTMFSYQSVSCACQETCDHGHDIPAAFSDAVVLYVNITRRANLDSRSFANTSLPNLNCLILSGVQHILPEGLKAFRNLNKLVLRNNFLLVLESGTFKTFLANGSVYELDAAGESIMRIEGGAFMGLSNVHHLNLTNNSIWTINEETFHGLDSLKTLDLSRNNIVRISNNTFLHVPNLTRLLLYSNRINHVESGAFIGPTQLTSINLQNNSIQVMSRSAFPKDANVKPKLNLIDNPLFCNCHLQWMKEWFDSGRDYITGNCSRLLSGCNAGTSIAAVYLGDKCPLHCPTTNGSTVAATVGGVMQLPCPYADATWVTPKFDSLSIPGQQWADHWYLSDDSTLVVWNVQKEDEGWYHCHPGLAADLETEGPMAYKISVDENTVAQLVQFGLPILCLLALCGLVGIGLGTYMYCRKRRGAANFHHCPGRNGEEDEEDGLLGREPALTGGSGSYARSTTFSESEETPACSITGDRRTRGCRKHSSKGRKLLSSGSVSSRRIVSTNADSKCKYSIHTPYLDRGIVKNILLTDGMMDIEK